MPNLNNLLQEKGIDKKTTCQKKGKTVFIHWSKIRRSPWQYCDAKEIEEIENLADLIELSGKVLQDVLVRKVGADEYEIIAGHKRVQACELIDTQRGKKEFALVPCQVEEVDDIATRFMVVATNQFHKKTDWEIMHEITEMEALLTKYPEKFPNIPTTGRMVERLATAMQMSKSTVGNFKKIDADLGKKGKELFKKGDLDYSAAYEMSGLPKKEQEALIKRGNTSHKEIKRYKKEKQSVPESGTFEDAKDEQLPGQLNIHDLGVPKEKSEGKLKVIEINNPVPYKYPFSGEKPLEQDLVSFLNQYNKWEIWCVNGLTQEQYFRCEIDSDTAIVVREYPYSTHDKRDSIGTTYYFLDKKCKYFADGKTTKKFITEKLLEREKKDD